MKVKLLQIASDEREVQEVRVARVLDIIDSDTNIDTLLILPEHWISGAFIAEPDLRLSENLYHSFLKDARDICRRKNVALVSGTGLSISDENLVTNTSFFISPTATELIPYSKTHRFRFELGSIVAGESVTVLHHLGFKISILICYDLRFPEAFRQSENFGSDVFIVVAAWPKSRIDVWLHLLKARALENQCFVIGVNGVGKQGFEILGGHSRVFAPSGDELAAGGDFEEIIQASLSLEQVKQHRIEHSYLKDAHFLSFTQNEVGSNGLG